MSGDIATWREPGSRGGSGGAGVWPASDRGGGGAEPRSDARRAERAAGVHRWRCGPHRWAGHIA